MSRGEDFDIIALSWPIPPLIISSGRMLFMSKSSSRRVIMSRGEDMRSAELPPPAEDPEDMTAIIVNRSFEEDDESSPSSIERRKGLFIIPLPEPPADCIISNLWTSDSPMLDEDPLKLRICCSICICWMGFCCDCIDDKPILVEGISSVLLKFSSSAFLENKAFGWLRTIDFSDNFAYTFSSLFLEAVFSLTMSLMSILDSASCGSTQHSLPLMPAFLTMTSYWLKAPLRRRNI